MSWKPITECIKYFWLYPLVYNANAHFVPTGLLFLFISGFQLKSWISNYEQPCSTEVVRLSKFTTESTHWLVLRGTCNHQLRKRKSFESIYCRFIISLIQHGCCFQNSGLTSLCPFPFANRLVLQPGTQLTGSGIVRAANWAFYFAHFSLGADPWSLTTMQQYKWKYWHT